MTGERENRRIRFGPFDFDPATGELRRSGLPIRLQPQPAQVLTFLLTRPGEVILRGALREQLWGADTFVDFDRGLNFCIAQIRSALGDSPDSPVYIKTLPKRGYQFIAPVTVAAPPVLPAIDSRAERPTLRNFHWKLVAALALIAALASAAFLWLRVPTPEAVIAIARFENLTGDPGLDRFAESLHNAVIAEFASRKRLDVIGNAAILMQPRAKRDLLRVHQTLQADRIVLGSLEPGHGAPQVLLQFLSLPDQVHLKVARMPVPVDAQPFDLAPALVKMLLTGPFRTR